VRAAAADTLPFEAPRGLDRSEVRDGSTGSAERQHD